MQLGTVVDRQALQSQNMRMALQASGLAGWTQIASAEAPPCSLTLGLLCPMPVSKVVGKALVGQYPCHALPYVTVKHNLLSSYAKHAVHPTGSRVPFSRDWP